uniref:hypothetical protein n=1 Tax=Ningiella ruwaisensis TaxID=2364274 RepID=UPI001446B32B|nr:hypothetical protein [Ningiella ruwaisensis]
MKNFVYTVSKLKRGYATVDSSFDYGAIAELANRSMVNYIPGRPYEKAHKKAD